MFAAAETAARPVRAASCKRAFRTTLKQLQRKHLQNRRDILTNRIVTTRDNGQKLVLLHIERSWHASYCILQGDPTWTAVVLNSLQPGVLLHRS